ncbi:hypothetical protein ABW19_dt0202158 [Dactylella cylindrospora]|nr:hypothetical protein ABW19_dt0202158 [Dactylella cylindrospora]
MAEILGLVIGGISLVTVFSTAISLCECVRFSKSFGQDYETALTKLSILRLRLSRWAAAVREQPDDFATQEDGQVALKILERITYLFQETQKLSLKYSGNMALYDPIGETGTDARNLVNTVGKVISQRQKRTRMFQRTVWAVYDKENFNKLLEDVTELVDGLVELFPAEKLPVFREKQQSLCEEDLNILDQSKIPLQWLSEAASGTDGILKSRIELRIEANPKHLYIGNQVGGRAKVKFGDEYLRGYPYPSQIATRGNLYKDNVIQGEAFVHCGDTFGGCGFLETSIVADANLLARTSIEYVYPSGYITSGLPSLHLASRRYITGSP